MKRCLARSPSPSECYHTPFIGQNILRLTFTLFVNELLLNSLISGLFLAKIKADDFIKALLDKSLDEFKRNLNMSAGLY
jgi:hypothetical protein